MPVIRSQATPPVYADTARRGILSAAAANSTAEHLRADTQRSRRNAAHKVGSSANESHSLIATLLGCDPNEVFVTAGATDAYQRILSALDIPDGSTLLTTTAEFSSTFFTLREVARRSRSSLRVVPVTGDPAEDLLQIEHALDDSVALMSLTHVASDSGVRHDVDSLATVAMEQGVFVIVDAAQSLGQMPVDLSALPCDALVATGQKYLRGPSGTGFGFVRQASADLLSPLLLDLAGVSTWQTPLDYAMKPGAARFADRYRSDALDSGLAVAVREALAVDLDDVARHAAELAGRLIASLHEVDGIETHEPLPSVTGIVTLNIRGHDPRATVARLAERHCHVSAVRRGLRRFSHGPARVVRASFHLHNTTDDVDLLATELAAVAADRRD
jgi:selenocysteine lyase/cysteine desulfurase